MKRSLIVDDEVSTRDFFYDSLPDAGYTVSLADTAEEAFKKLDWWLNQHDGR